MLRIKYTVIKYNNDDYIIAIASSTKDIISIFTATCTAGAEWHENTNEWTDYQTTKI